MRARPPTFRALGKADPPISVIVQGMIFHRLEIYKHDSWAATARYQGEAFDIVCKFNRTQPIFIVPMTWLGRILANRERDAYDCLSHVEGIASGCGPVRVGTTVLENAVAHQFVPGHPLRPNEKPGDAFFAKLQLMLGQLHQAGFAYVDLHKRENILVSEHGEPYLVDFQICFQNNWVLARRRLPLGWLLRMFQRSDLFCLAKHVYWHRRDQLAALGLEASWKIPWWIRMHRWFAVPFRQGRRKLLSKLGIRDRSGKATSEVFTEHALRR